MTLFKSFELPKPLLNAIDELGFVSPTPVQAKSFAVIRSGKDIVGIAQTGTGKTLAYILPLLTNIKYSDQDIPRVLILVPTRELVLQVTSQIKDVAKYTNIRVVSIYGGTNIKNQKIAIAGGVDIVVATPGRLYDLAIDRSLQLKGVRKLVIDEVDVMLDLGFRFQLSQIFDLLLDRRQNIMFSATMTDEIDLLINEYFKTPEKISIAVSGTPLDNIEQQCYRVKNYHTKVNLLVHLLNDKNEYKKVLVFVSNKKRADRLFESLSLLFGEQVCVIHSNKSQNFRLKSIESFDTGLSRVLVATDVIARGLDLEKISHVINFDTPHFPENYMHRIGRTGRAEEQGKSVLFYDEKEEEFKDAVEQLMDYKIPLIDFPTDVEISAELIPEERPVVIEKNRSTTKADSLKSGFHEKKAKNKKSNQGGSYKRKLEKKYKKRQTRGDKTYNKRNKKKK
jgi:ATP-dependent RNA helicase RhlE